MAGRSLPECYGAPSFKRTEPCLICGLRSLCFTDWNEKTNLPFRIIPYEKNPSTLPEVDIDVRGDVDFMDNEVGNKISLILSKLSFLAPEKVKNRWRLKDEKITFVILKRADLRIVDLFFPYCDMMANKLPELAQYGTIKRTQWLKTDNSKHVKEIPWQKENIKGQQRMLGLTIRLQSKEVLTHLIKIVPPILLATRTSLKNLSK